MKIRDLIEQLLVIRKANPKGELLYYCDCCSQCHVFRGDILTFDNDKDKQNENIT